MTYSNFRALNGSPRATRRTRRTLNANPDFPDVLNVEQALVELGKRWWSFPFKKKGYTPEAYHELLLFAGFEYRDGREITEHTVACTLNNLTRPEYGERMDVLKFRWGRRGARDLMQYAPSGKIADTLNADDEFFSEVMRSHRHFSAWRLMSLWHQSRLQE